MFNVRRCGRPVLDSSYTCPPPSHTAITSGEHEQRTHAALSHVCRKFAGSTKGESHLSDRTSTSTEGSLHITAGNNSRALIAQDGREEVINVNEILYSVHKENGVP